MASTFPTDKHKRIHEWLLEYQSSHGHGPTYGEIAKQWSMASNQTVYSMLKTFERNGLVELPGRGNRRESKLKIMPWDPDLWSIMTPRSSAAKVDPICESRKRNPRTVALENKRRELLEMDRTRHKPKLTEAELRESEAIRKPLDLLIDYMGLRLDGASMDRQNAAWEELMVGIKRLQQQ